MNHKIKIFSSLVAILYFILFAINSVNAQQQHFFTPEKKYVYQAVYIRNSKDTLSKEKIELQGTGQIWDRAPSQTLAKITYFTTSDTAVFNPPINKVPIRWSHKVEEGVIDDGRKLWMHPFRFNQYYLTEIAPFPSYYFDGTIVIKSKIIIGEGWGTFKGKSREKYNIEGSENIAIESNVYVNCTKVYAIGKHRLGKNTNTFFVHPEYGFVKMHYQFFNGDQIIFNLIAIEKDKE